MSEKIVMKLYDNGDLEIVDTPINRSLVGNMLNANDTINGYIWNGGALDVSYGAVYKASDYLAVTPSTEYALKCTWAFENPHAYWVRIAYYDINKNFISLGSEYFPFSSFQTEWVCPQNVRYVRISFYFQNANDTIINFTQKSNMSKISFSDQEILAPIVEYPPVGYRNYFIENTTVQGYLNIDSVVELPSNENERTSDFINIQGWTSVTIRIRYVGIDSNLVKPWIAIQTFDINKQSTSSLHRGYITPPNNRVHLFGATYSVNAAFLRISSNYLDSLGADVKISVEQGDTTNPKHYLASEDLPLWVVDTGNPVSIFPEGIVIKGNLIQTNT